MGICKPDFNSSDFDSRDFQTDVIDFSFQTFLQNRLPDYFRRNDTYIDERGDGLLLRYLSIFGDEIDQEVIPTIECYLNIINTQNCDPKYLIHLSDVLGNPPDVFKDDNMYRNLLSYICSVYKIKGTKRAYELFFSLLGFTIDLKEIPANEGITNYDENGEYDKEGVYYDVSKCTSCTYYDITFYPKPGNNYTLSGDIVNKLKAAIEFNEPINAKLRYLTLSIQVQDSIGIKLNDSSKYLVDKVNIYDVGNEYDSEDLYYDKEGGLQNIKALQNKAFINLTPLNNNNNNYQLEFSLYKNFLGSVDPQSTQLTLKTYDSTGKELSRIDGTIIRSWYYKYRIYTKIIKENLTIKDYHTIRLTGKIGLENGMSCQVNTVLHTGENSVTLYFT